MKLDLATTAFLAQLAGMGGKPLHEMSAQEARLVGGAIAAAYPPGPATEAEITQGDIRPRTAE